MPGHKWDALLSNWIRGNRSLILPEEKVADRLISYVEEQRGLTFLVSKFPLFGFMKEVAKDQKKHPKLYLWQGEADAIAYSWNLGKYVIVDFKVVDNLLDYEQKKLIYVRSICISAWSMQSFYSCSWVLTTCRPAWL